MRFLGLLIFLGLCGAAFATDYYVSPWGDDANPGTSAETRWLHTPITSMGRFHDRTWSTPFLPCHDYEGCP